MSHRGGISKRMTREAFAEAVSNGRRTGTERRRLDALEAFRGATISTCPACGWTGDGRCAVNGGIGCTDGSLIR